MNDLQNQVLHIKETIENGITYADAGMEIDAEANGYDSTDIINGFDYLQDALDIQYIVDSNGEYLGARVLVAFGGPNIWIDTLNQRIEGAWWQDKFDAYYNDDAMDIDEALRELWNCK